MGCSLISEVESMWKEIETKGPKSLKVPEKVKSRYHKLKRKDEIEHSYSSGVEPSDGSGTKLSEETCEAEMKGKRMNRERGRRREGGGRQSASGEER